MSFRRRLFHLECRPFRRPIEKPRFTELDERIRKKLCLPLPREHTREEFEQALELMKAAQKTPIEDQAGWAAVRRYTLSIHRKYGGEYADAPDEWVPLT